VEAAVEGLMRTAWGEDWPKHAGTLERRYVEAASSGEAAGIRYEALKLDHGDLDCRGYRLHLDGRVLAYAGDTIASPPLDELVRGADVAITEATAPGASEVHTSWEEAEALAARHPDTRFLFNHVFAGTLSMAVQDLSVVDV
jgi:ribonuclease BN (tRNA processing enzyme)